MIPTQDPTAIWATGMAWSISAGVRADSNVLITKIPIGFTSHQTVKETSGAPPSPVWNNSGGGPWGAHANWYSHFKNQAPFMGSTNHNRTSGDMGFSIRQLKDGNIVTAGIANIIMHFKQGITPPLLVQYNTDHGTDIRYWTDGDAYATLIDHLNFPTPGLPSAGGYEIAAKHIAHFSGMEYFVKVRQDYDDNLFFTGSNGDTLVAPTYISPLGTERQLFSSFYVVKTDKNLDPLWNKAYTGHKIDEITCGFGSTVCTNNQLVVTGDNKFEKDNYDMIRLFNCVDKTPNYDLFPTTPNSFDFISISTLDLLGTPGTLTFTSPTKLKGRLIIESGCTVDVNGVELQFADLDRLDDLAYSKGFEHGIVINPGGKLILRNGAVLTSVTDCNAKWRGVQVSGLGSGTANQSIPSTIGILEMTDSRIENAVIGASIEGGGLITCSNSKTNMNHVNFLNNRKGVSFYSFAGPNLSRFNFTNFDFVSPLGIRDFGIIGLNTHCSMWDVENIIFNGCTFKNQYTGPYRLGFGIASIDASFQVIRGNNSSIGNPCNIPTGRTTEFENLTYGMVTDRTPSNTITRFIGVAEAKFTNCGVGWQCDDDNKPLAYENEFIWNDVLGNYPTMPNFPDVFGLSYASSSNVKVFENTFSTNGSIPFAKAGIIITNPNSGSFKSVLRKNFFTKTGSTFEIGVMTSGNNDLFELRCSEFTDMKYFDWHNNGLNQDQIDLTDPFNPEHFNNKHWTNPLTSHVHSNTGSGLFDYHHTDPSLSVTGDATLVPTSLPAYDCTKFDECIMYNPLGNLNGDDIFELADIGILMPRMEEIIWQHIKAKNYPEALALTDRLEDFDYKRFLNLAIPILKEHREMKPTTEEVETLKEIALSNTSASLNAKHFLSFFLEILVNKKVEFPAVSTNNNLTASSKNVKKSELVNLRVFPNPTKGLINFEWNMAANLPVTLSITDVNGKLVYENKNLESKFIQTVDLKSQPRGIYIYKIFTNNRYVKTGKIVLSH